MNAACISAFLPLVVIEVVSKGKESTYSVLHGGLCLKIIAASAHRRSASGLIGAAFTQIVSPALSLRFQSGHPQHFHRTPVALDQV